MDGSGDKSATRAGRIGDFLRRERVEIGQGNVDRSTEYERHLPELRRRLARRTTFVVTCMDERCGGIEDRLELLHGEAIVMATYGGRIEPDDFDRLFGVKIRHSVQARRQTAIYLVAHRESGDPERGCAAFGSDPAEQVTAFSALLEDLRRRYPDAFTHFLSLDTATGLISPEKADQRDDHLVAVLSGRKNLTDSGTAAGGEGTVRRGIYVGDAYRSWILPNDRFMRLSALDPNLEADLKTAIRTVMEAEKGVPTDRPYVIQIDSPIYPDVKLSGNCRRNIEQAVNQAVADPEILAAIDDGRVGIIKTETEMGSQKGFAVG
ncbi:hypothetical protein JW899_00915 [Candidatus Uhrbacteria bacterium]|nr:hypothetical protein [Candidatus Uhrbacteria bacterium]